LWRTVGILWAPERSRAVYNSSTRIRSLLGRKSLADALNIPITTSVSIETLLTQ
jgi:hypothetical protein